MSAAAGHGQLPSCQPHTVLLPRGSPGKAAVPSPCEVTMRVTTMGEVAQARPCAQAFPGSSPSVHEAGSRLVQCLCSALHRGANSDTQRRNSPPRSYTVLRTGWGLCPRQPGSGVDPLCPTGWELYMYVPCMCLEPSHKAAFQKLENNKIWIKIPKE